MSECEVTMPVRVVSFPTTCSRQQHKSSPRDPVVVSLPHAKNRTDVIASSTHASNPYASNTPDSSALPRHTYTYNTNRAKKSLLGGSPRSPSSLDRPCVPLTGMPPPILEPKRHYSMITDAVAEKTERLTSANTCNSSSVCTAVSSSDNSSRTSSSSGSHTRQLLRTDAELLDCPLTQNNNSVTAVSSLFDSTESATSMSDLCSVASYSSFPSTPHSGCSTPPLFSFSARFVGVSMVTLLRPQQEEDANAGASTATATAVSSVILLPPDNNKPSSGHSRKSVSIALKSQQRGSTPPRPMSATQHPKHAWGFNDCNSDCPRGSGRNTTSATSTTTTAAAAVEVIMMEDDSQHRPNQNTGNHPTAPPVHLLQSSLSNIFSLVQSYPAPPKPCLPFRPSIPPRVRSPPHCSIAGPPTPADAPEDDDLSPRFHVLQEPAVPDPFHPSNRYHPPSMPPAPDRAVPPMPF